MMEFWTCPGERSGRFGCIRGMQYHENRVSAVLHGLVKEDIALFLCGCRQILAEVLGSIDQDLQYTTRAGLDAVYYNS